MGSLERRCRAEWRRIADDQAAHLLWGSPREGAAQPLCRKNVRARWGSGSSVNPALPSGSPRRIGRRHWPEVCLIDRHFVVLAGPFAYVVSPWWYHDCAPGRTGVSA
jgi:hypothetical protein